MRDGNCRGEKEARAAAYTFDIGKCNSHDNDTLNALNRNAGGSVSYVKYILSSLDPNGSLVIGVRRIGKQADLIIVVGP